jgi:ribonuclease HI
MHYYNALPSSYHHRLEEKSIDNIRSSLQTCLEYEEKLERTGLPKEDYAKQTDMSTILQLMQDINNHMIYFERKGITSTSTIEASTQAATKNFMSNNFQPKAIFPRAWCNFCEDHHDESTCEVKKNVRDRIFGKKPRYYHFVLDWAPQDDVMVVNTINKSYANKGKDDSSKTTFSPSTSSQNTGSQVAHNSTSHQVTAPSSKYNILNQLANIKADATLLDMVTIPEQQQHLRDFMEGKTSNIANLTKDYNEEESYVNRIGVNNFRRSVNYPPFYISVNILDKIAHCCLIDGGSGPSVMSNIIMEELGLSCTNENARSMLSYNNQQQSTIGEIKDVTLVLCAHPEIHTTLNIQVIDMPVSNYSIILGRDWKALTGGYLSLDGSHLSIPKDGKNIIVLREDRISPYIEKIPQLNVNYVEESLGVYSIFTEEDDMPHEQFDYDDGMWHMHFDGACSNEGNGVGIILYSPVGKIHNFSFRLEFTCTNNVVEFEALLLGIENAYNLGCGHLTIFGDSELVVNLVRKIYNPNNKLMKRYTQVIWALILNMLSFNITHIKRELNTMADRLAVFACFSYSTTVTTMT